MVTIIRQKNEIFQVQLVLKRWLTCRVRERKKPQSNIAYNRPDPFNFAVSQTSSSPDFTNGLSPLHLPLESPYSWHNERKLASHREGEKAANRYDQRAFKPRRPARWGKRVHSGESRSERRLEARVRRVMRSRTRLKRLGARDFLRLISQKSFQAAVFPARMESVQMCECKGFQY